MPVRHIPSRIFSLSDIYAARHIGITRKQSEGQTVSLTWGSDYDYDNKVATMTPQRTSECPNELVSEQPTVLAVNAVLHSGCQRAADMESSICIQGE